MGSEILIIFFLVTIGWCATRIILRNNKRKIYGKKLLVVKDVTSYMDLFFGVLFLLLGLRTLVIFLQGSLNIFMFFLAGPLYLAAISPIYFVKAFSKVEIYEDGVLSRGSLWKWDITEGYLLKEEKKTVSFNFKLNRRFLKSTKIVVLKSDKDKVENALIEIFQI